MGSPERRVALPPRATAPLGLAAVTRILAFPGTPSRQLSFTVVAALVAVYNEVVSKLLPTPAKFFYTFNLRDVTRAVQGMVMADATTFKETSDMVLLWAHETLRVFYDRACMPIRTSSQGVTTAAAITHSAPPLR